MDMNHNEIKPLCKAEFDRVCTSVIKDFKVECDLKNLIFSDMTVEKGKCVAVFQIPNH